MKKSEKTKATILNSSIKILNENSYLTFKEISSDCGVNVASINYHYGSKENLIHCIEEKIVEELKQIVGNAIKENTDKSADNMLELTHIVIDEIYRYAFKYIGIFKYMISPNNSASFYSFINMFNEIFSLESDFANNITKFLSKFAQHSDHTTNVIKYIILVSSFLFPLIFDIKLIESDLEHPFSLKAQEYKDKYIEALMEIIKY